MCHSLLIENNSKNVNDKQNRATELYFSLLLAFKEFQ